MLASIAWRIGSIGLDLRRPEVAAGEGMYLPWKTSYHVLRNSVAMAFALSFLHLL